MKTVTELWQELMAVYKEEGYSQTSAVLTLHPPINATELQALQRTIKGAVWPKEYFELLSIHNGSGVDKDGLENFSIGTYFFMTSTRAITCYHRTNKFVSEELADTNQKPQRTQSGVQHVFWDLKWFPIMRAEDSNAMFCIDFNPAPGGKMGQIISVSYDSGVWKKWDDFSHFFKEQVETIVKDPEHQISLNAADQKILDEHYRLVEKERREKSRESKPPVWSRWLGDKT